MSNKARQKPIILAYAGPNGSGKTTVASAFPPVGTYVNADDIRKEYGLTALDAARQAENIRRALLKAHVDFTFETVLSTDRNLLLMREAGKEGYEVQCIYVLTHSADINVARVRERKLKGGHDVPEDKIRSRHVRALALLPEVVAACDKILVIDNSNEMPALIFRKEDNIVEYLPNNDWPIDRLSALIIRK